MTKLCQLRLMSICAILAVMIAFPPLESSAQSCLPPDDPNCPWATKTLDLTFSGCRVQLVYRYRVCGGVVEYEYISGPTIIGGHNNCNVLEDFSIYHHNISSLREYLDLHIISTADWSFNITTPDCPATTQLVKFYSADCGVWVKCTYDIEPQTPNCEQGFSPLPDPQATTVDVWKWQSCGETCCKRTYTICRGNETHVGNSIQIQQMQKEKVGNCTEEPGGSNPVYAKPCKDGC